MAASATDVGRVRDHNEDACFIDADRGLFILSDGMGGHQAGALASQVVVQCLPDLIKQHLATRGKTTNVNMRCALRNAISSLSHELRRQSDEQPALQGMGATVVAVLIRRRYAHIAHVGDSRAYLLRNGELRQLTNDHSVVGILLRSQRITVREAASHPARGQLSRYVGMEDATDPDVRTIALRKGDRLLLCSDGLTGMLTDRHILKVLRSLPDPQAACHRLIEAANQAGGRDNITVMVVST